MAEITYNTLLDDLGEIKTRLDRADELLIEKPFEGRLLVKDAGDRLREVVNQINEAQMEVRS